MLDLNIPEEKVAYNEMADWLLKKASGTAWNATVQVGGKLKVLPHNNRPCYGELRRYGQHSTRPKDYHPGDLPNPIIECDERLAVAVYMPVLENDKRQPVIDMVFSKDSPWRKGFDFDQIEWIKESGGGTRGFIMNSGSFQPTVFVNALIQLRNFFIYGGPGIEQQYIQIQKDYDLPFKLAYLHSMYVTYNAFFAHMPRGYVFHFGSYPQNFLKGESRDLDEGKTWGQLADYNRPGIPFLFYDEAPERKKGYPMFFSENILGDKSFDPRSKVTKEFSQKFAEHLKEIEATLDES